MASIVLTPLPPIFKIVWGGKSSEKIGHFREDLGAILCKYCGGGVDLVERLQTGREETPVESGGVPGEDDGGEETHQDDCADSYSGVPDVGDRATGF